MREAIDILAALLVGGGLGALVVDYLKLRKEIKGWRAWAGSLRAGRRQPPAPVAEVAAPAPGMADQAQAPGGEAEIVARAIAAQDRPHTPRQAKRRPSWFQLGLKRERADLIDVAKQRQEDLARHRQEVIEAARRDNTRPPAPPVALVEPIESEEAV